MLNATIAGVLSHVQLIKSNNNHIVIATETSHP